MTTLPTPVPLGEAIASGMLRSGNILQGTPGGFWIWYKWPDDNTPMTGMPNYRKWYYSGEEVKLVRSRGEEECVVYLAGVCDLAPDIIYLKVLHPEHGLLIGRFVAGEKVYVLGRNTEEEEEKETL